MAWSKDKGTVAKVNADYAKAQGDVAKQEATNLSQLKSDVEVATQNASTAADNAVTATSNADNAASEAIAQANHAKNEGNRAKAEADRLAGTDVSVLDNKIGSLSSLNTTNKTSVVESVNEVTTQLAQTKEQVSNVSVDITAPPYNVKQDGSDQTDKLTQVINEILSNGKTPYIPQGRYGKSDTINIDFPGEVIVSPNAEIIELVRGKNGFTINSSNVTITGATFKGVSDRLIDSASYSIRVNAKHSNIKINSCTFNGYTGGIFLLSENENIDITGCSFYNMTYIPEANAGGYGIVFQASKNTRTSNCYFDGSVERHHIYLGKSQSNEALLGHTHLFIGNTFIGESKQAYSTGNEFLLKIMGNEDVTVVGNNFTGGLGHIWLTAVYGYNPKNIVISSNTFSNIVKGNSPYSSAIGTGGSYTVAESVIISNNVFKNCDCFSHITFGSGVNCQIKGNIISSIVSGHGISSYGSLVDCTVSDVEIYNVPATNRGIFINFESVTNGSIVNFNNVTVHGGLIGLLANNLIGGSVQNCTFKKSTQDSLRIQNSVYKGVIKNNVFEDGINGIYLMNPVADPIYVYGNTFRNIGSYNIVNVNDAPLLEPINASGVTRNNKRVYVRNSPPTQGPWTLGDVAINITPSVGSYAGFVYVSSNGGEWKGYGLIS